MTAVATTPAGMPLNQRLVQLPAYAQMLFWPMRYKVLYGGRGAGRSWNVARALLLLAAQRPLRILCTRELQTSLKDSVMQLLKDQIALMGLEGFTALTSEIRHENGSLFLFEGLRHNVNRIKSLEGIDIVWVEEAERISKDSWDVLIPTIRKSGSEIWITFNPDQEDDATYKRFILKPPKNCWRKKVSWADNPWLTDELRDEKDYAYETDPEAAEWVWGGNIRRISEAQILRGKWIVQEFTVPYYVNDADQEVYLWDGPYQGMDFGFGSDPAAAVRLWVHSDILYVEYEGWKLHLEIDDMPQQWKDDIPGFEKYRTRADSSRPDSISFLKRYGLPNVRPARKHAGSVEDGIAHLRSYRQIIIHPRCKRFAAEARLYSYKVDQRSKDVLPIIVDKHNHLIDSARYALDPLIKPRRQARVVFVDDLKPKVCPDCDSTLSEDGDCPHCGWEPGLAEEDSEREPAYAGAHESDTVVTDEQLEDVVDVPRIDTRHTNGNGHKNGNGNGKSRLRGIND